MPHHKVHINVYNFKTGTFSNTFLTFSEFLCKKKGRHIFLISKERPSFSHSLLETLDLRLATGPQTFLPILQIVKTPLFYKKKRASVLSHFFVPLYRLLFNLSSFPFIGDHIGRKHNFNMSLALRQSW